MADPHDYINQQRRQELERAVEHDQGSLLGPFAAGIGVIGLGAVLLKTRLSSGGKTLSNLFNFLGAPRGISLASDIAANVGGSTARSNTTGLRSLLTGSWNAKTQRLHLGPLDLIDDLRTATEVIGLTDRPIAEAFRDRTTEYINRRFSNAGNNTGYFTHGLHRVTIGQVLDEQEKWSRVVGTNQWDTLKKAVDTGLARRDHILDRGIFYSSARDEVIDLRLRNLTSKVVEHPAQKGTFQRVSRFDIFGQGRVLDSIVGSRRRVAVLTGNEAWSGPRYFVDGKIFGYEKTADGYQEMLLAEGRKLRSTGDPFEPIAAARAGQLTLRPNARKGTFGKLLTKFEHATGVGPSFATRPSFLDRFVINPIKRFNAIRSGEAVVYKAPFRREFGAGKIADAVLGHDMPELTTASGAIVPVPGGGVAVPFKDIKGSMFFGLLPKKVGVLFDLVDDYSVIKTNEYQALKSGARRRGRSTITSKDFTVPLPSGGYRISGRSVASDSPLSRYSDVQRDVLTAGGTISKSHRTAYYDVAKSRVLPGATSLRDFGSYLFYRVNDLASMSGLGFAPAKTMVGNMARLAAVPVIGLAALRAFEYADYLAESYTGISPTKLAASAYATLRVLQQKVREYTGIQQGAAALESAFPGSVDSEGATLARSIIAPAWTFAKVASKSGLGVAAAAAGIVEALIGGPSPGQPSSELSEEYTGERKVPVRKGRFWGLGFTSWGGGAPERFDYSWYHKLQSDYRVNSIYGSKDEYWNYHADVFGIPFPTIDNALGIRNLINPYRLEEINYHDRPYMRTEHALTNFPIVGPLLGATIGKLLKPTIERQSDMPLLRAGLADRGLDPEAAELLGMGRLNATAVAFRDPNSTLTTVSRLANVASEPMGLYKFIMEFFGVKFDQGSTPILATSRNIAAPGRALYDTSLGGALGQTELIRRFMLSDYDTPYGRSDQINQLRNNMPTFMPGQASEFEKDKSYFIDFTVGDPFGKLTDGESRLPGKGYESLNELHSGTAGQYSEVDRFLILADVAPWSDAYKRYESKVRNMNLDPKWAKKVEQALLQREQVLGVDTRYKRHEEEIADLNEASIFRGLYSMVRSAYDTVTHDVLAEIPYIGSKLFPFRSPYEQYRKTQIEGAEFASWDRPWEAIMRPMFYDVATEDPATAAMKGAGIGFLLSGPMRWFNPLRGTVGGASLVSPHMGTVVGGAGAAAAISVGRIGMGYGQDMIPGHIQAESDAINYMDMLTYTKYRSMEQLALDEGRSDVASNMRSMARKTMVAANNPLTMRSTFPRSTEKKYFDYFSQIGDQSMREQILGGTTPYMSRALQSTYSQNYPSMTQADQEAELFLQNQQIPTTDWLGYHPAVSTKSMKLKMIEHGFNGVSDDFHRFGFYETHKNELLNRLPDLYNQELVFTQSPIHQSYNQFLVNHARKIRDSFKSHEVLTRSTPYGAVNNVSSYTDRSPDTLMYVDSYMSR